MKKAQKEDAVSPVIGVMLMLVVTIVIAAVVAAFATGMGSGMETVPSAALKSTVLEDGSVYLSSISGDEIDLNKVTVIVYYTTIENGEETQKKQSFFNPSKLPGVGKSLESGETIDVAKASETSSSLSLTKGDIVEVVVQYDSSSILYDEEVIVE